MDTLANEILDLNESNETVVNGTELMKAANTAPISYLLKAARAMGCHDYAIKHYYCPNSKTFYKNKDTVRKACRKRLQDKATPSWQIDRMKNNPDAVWHDYPWGLTDKQIKRVFKYT